MGHFQHLYMCLHITEAIIIYAFNYTSYFGLNMQNFVQIKKQQVNMNT